MDDKILRRILREELSGYATRQDLEKLATKDDIKILRQEIKTAATKTTKDISDIVTKFVQVIEDRKADRSQTLSHEVRLNELERKVFPQ